MTHTIDCKRATTPHRRAHVRTSAPQPIGEACAVVGSRASRVFALRNGETGIGHKQMRCRAFPEGGVP
jgi:hypothetical protein